MANRSRSLRRRGARLDSRPRILIVCEGSATEPGYFSDLRQIAHVRAVEVVVDDASGVPKTLVERAVVRKKASERDARRAGDINLRFDEVWCVFDVDAHPRLDEALQQAAANGIRVALSNPCFELWVLLHFQDQRGFIDRHSAARACRRHLPRYEKHVTYRELAEHYDLAVQRAEALVAWQETRGCVGDNPTTFVHRLTERLHSLGRDSVLAQIRRHSSSG